MSLFLSWTVEGLAAARSRSRSDNTPCCHSLRSRRYATPVPTGFGENFDILLVGEDIILPLFMKNLLHFARTTIGRPYRFVRNLIFCS